jgi:hypothetical protein
VFAGLDGVYENHQVVCNNPDEKRNYSCVGDFKQSVRPRECFGGFVLGFHEDFFGLNKN